MPLDPPEYDLDLPTVIERLKAVLDTMRDTEFDHLVTDMPADIAFITGYETCLNDLITATGPNPIEMGWTIVTPREDAE